MNVDPNTGVPPVGAESEDVFTLRALLGVVWRRLWVVSVGALLVCAAVLGFSLTQTPIYESSTEIVIGQEQRGAPGTLQSDLLGLQQLALTAVEAVDSRRVAQDVVRELDLRMTPETLLGNLSVQQVEGTQFIQIGYRDPDPEQARRVADAIAEVSSDRISEVSPSANIEATVWEQATKPGAPVSPDVGRNGILALLLGIMLGTGLAFLLEYLDDSWRSPEEVESVAGVPTFGIVPIFKAPRAKRKGGG